MGIFIIGLVLFLGIHTVSIVAPQWRDGQVARLGEGPWKVIYSVVSAIGLGLLIYGYGLARQNPVVLYSPPAALRHLALLVMLPVFPLLVAAYVPGRIKAMAKHPMLLATKLWALAHLLANGTLADALRVGGSPAAPVADRITGTRRPARPGPGAPRPPHTHVIVVVVGLALYALFVLWAHRRLFGVSPLPSLQ